MRAAFFDCQSGASGNMFLGAFLDAGAPRATLDRAVHALDLGEAVVISVEPRVLGDVPASYVEVAVTQPRSWGSVADIDAMIRDADLEEGVRERSRLAFRLLADAEAKAHGVPKERVRLHEAGAVDAVVDVVGSFALAEALGVEAFYSSALPLCRGEITSEHGTIPLPAPATVNILEAVGAPTYDREGDAELVTPTGAAIIGACAAFESPELTATQEGRGAGSQVLAWPNVLRVVVGDLAEAGLAAEAASPELVDVIETNIDDMAPNLLAEIPRRLLEAGALDAFLTPVVMKKGRSGHLLTVVCGKSATEALAARILEETSTLGVRVREERRIVAQRRFENLASSLGDARVKLKLADGRVVDAVPEFDDVRRLAELHGIAVTEAHRRLLEEARRQFVGPAG